MNQIKTWREREFEANGYVAVSPASNVIHMKAEIADLRQAIAQAEKDARNVDDLEPVTAMDITLDDDDQLSYLRDMIVQDDGELTPVRLLLGDGHSGLGLYVASADYPEEGAVLLAAVPSYTRPPTAPAQPPVWLMTQLINDKIELQRKLDALKAPVQQPLTDAQIVGYWKVYKIGQGSADHSAQEVFTQVIRAIEAHIKGEPK
jgi:hypothetical protein